MANQNLFSGANSRLARAEVFNEAGGAAYALSPKHALAQLAVTGTFNNTYYTQATAQLDTVRTLAEQVGDNAFLAKLAVYSRERAFLKDMPQALWLILSKRDIALAGQVFDRVVDNGRTLRTLVQMLRSGQFGRKCLSKGLQRLVNRWLNRASVGTLLSASIGDKPSLRDVLRLARPTPVDNTRRALFGWLTDKPIDKWEPATLADLPAEVGALTAFRQAEEEAAQVAILEHYRFRWDLLADSARGLLVWRAIARQMGHQALRMNLNTLQRHGVFDDAEQTTAVARRLADPEEIRRARQFPYQYLAAALHTDESIPATVRSALETAAETACGNVPALPGPVVIGLDVSGSMSSPVTGHQGGGTTRMRCVDAAALIAAAIVRRNPGSVVIPFDTAAYATEVSADEPILQLAARLAKFGGGGTDCSLPLKDATKRFGDTRFVGCVLVSDMESWVGGPMHGATGTLAAWQVFANRQRTRHGVEQPKLACINLQAYQTVQTPERADVLNVGGFSDAVFGVLANFFDGDAERFVAAIEAVEL